MSLNPLLAPAAPLLTIGALLDAIAGLLVASAAAVQAA